MYLDLLWYNMSMNNATTTDTRVAQVAVSFAVKSRLDNLASVTQQSAAQLANEALLNYLAEEEDFVADITAGLAEADAGELVDGDRVMEYIQSLWTETPLPEPKPNRA